MNRTKALADSREAGMSTAEYAIGVCGAGGFAGMLFKLLTSTWGQHLFDSIAKRVFGVLGL
ncbi:MAG: DUF4244 domain-containing protein [Frankiaceae bacterium]|jgi:hypothetical protein